jgi:gentisate 1,2-dioxygenase
MTLTPIQTTTATSAEAQFFDYGSAANPLQKGLISRIPYRSFPAAFFDGSGTELMPLDLSAELACEGPATGPSLCGNFIRIDHGELRTAADATSQLFFVARGQGRTETCGQTYHWTEGDTFVLPAGGDAVHSSDGKAGLYWVHDAPLLRYLGVSTVRPVFEPCFYSHRDARAHLEAIASNPRGANANRVSVLLGNDAFPQTRTVTHTLWAMLGILPKGQVQRPHRHQSIALDFAVECQPGCYTMIGTELDEHGMIRNGHREDWVSGAAFVTPPGYWHSHHNESGADAYVLPIQDAGLHTYLRTLDIAFSQAASGRDGNLSETP